MSMPLDLYVIRHGESEANVIVQAGEQGDNSLYTCLLYTSDAADEL